MNIVGHFTVLPHLPERIAGLRELAYNLYWSWRIPARRVFAELDRPLWEAVGHNPVQMLQEIEQYKLEAILENSSYLEQYDAVMQEFTDYMNDDATWFHQFCQENPESKNDVYAYFCAEYGWHESIALYSGGLGILAGDHTKSASDLGVPLVCIGLWYPEGYFHQRVNNEGQQEAVYQENSPTAMPFSLACTPEGEEARVSVRVADSDIELRAWKLHVGRVQVYLLDSNIPENDPRNRDLLRRLYGGDERTRIAQEMVLGIGGVRMLRALGIAPSSWHINEGHSAFLVLERCRELVEEGMTFEVAREVIATNTNFTVHTPVMAGNDAFHFDLVREFFRGYWGSLGLSPQQFLDLGSFEHTGRGLLFSIPALAIRFSTRRNGVAKLHGETSRRIWQSLWQEVPIEEVPIGHVTNGVDVATWVDDDIMAMVHQAVPEGTSFHDVAAHQAVTTIDNKALWEIRQRLMHENVRTLRKRVLRQQERLNASPTQRRKTENLFNPDVLTIGFARRFATYKRATLIFRDEQRLEEILNHPERPVQLVFAGKAHPKDHPGQQLIATIQRLSKDPRFEGKIIFIEDYDMSIGRALTRGCDVWLNNPRRPLEASGTSGMKAAMNGVLNVSILDGWWSEGYNTSNGWAIGEGVGISTSEAIQDDASDNRDADALYGLLEHEVIPMYYERDADGVPQAWIERAKASIASTLPVFDARRMVKDYVEQYYSPAATLGRRVRQNNHQAAHDLAGWKRYMHRAWSGLYFNARAIEDKTLEIGDMIAIEAVLNPRDIDPTSLKVEVVYSPAEEQLQHNLHTVTMEEVERYVDGGRLYRVAFKPQISGRLAYGVRVYPSHENLASDFDSHLIRWG